MATNYTNTATLSVSYSGKLTSDAAGQPGSVPVTASKALSFTNGVGAGKINYQYAGDHTMSAGGSVTIDLNGTLLDGLGRSFAPTKLRLLGITVTAGEGPCAMGGATQTFNPGMASATVTTTFYPAFLTTRTDATAFTVTAGSADLVVLTNSGSDTMTVRVVANGQG